MAFTPPPIPPTAAVRSGDGFDPVQPVAEDQLPRDREEASTPEQAMRDDPGADRTDPEASTRMRRSRPFDPDRIKGMAQGIMGFMDAAPEPPVPDPLPEIENAVDCLSRPIILPPEVVQGILHRGAKGVIGGGSKSYKTWVLSDLALSVATGHDWLGFPTNPGRVLYLNLELERAYYNLRLLKICEAKGYLSQRSTICQSGRCAATRPISVALRLRLSRGRKTRITRCSSSIRSTRPSARAMKIRPATSLVS